MPRLARKNITTSLLHIMVQGVNKEYIFEKDREKITYLNLMKEFDQPEFVDVLAYCIMSNHAHFAMYVQDMKELSKLMYKVNLKFAQMYNKINDRYGVLFRNRFQVQPIYNERHLLNCIEYIHQNPVKAGMVSRCEDYKFSSYNDYKENKGLAKSKIFRELYGEDCNLMKMFKGDFGKIFIDVEDLSHEEINAHIIAGTKEFVEFRQIKLQDIFCNRETLKELIEYLKKECEIPYVYTRNFFEISRGVMNSLKINN